MTYFRRDSWIQDVQGNALAGARLWVCYQPARVFKTRPPEPLAQIFRDAQGMELEEIQPRKADGTGHFVYYAVPGFYTEVFFFQGRVVRVLRDQAIGVLGATTPETGFSTAALTSENVFGQPQPGQLVLIHTFAFESTFPLNFSSPTSYATRGTAATNLAVYVITLNGINRGTVTFSPTGGALFQTPGFVAEPGDRLEMKAPDPMDATLSDVAITLAYTRTGLPSIGVTAAITSENVFGQPQPGQLVMISTFAFQASFPANFTNPRSYATAAAAATNPAVYVVMLNGISVGTVTFPAAGAVVFQTVGFTVQPGDRLTMLAPDPMDETLSDVAITLAYTRLT